MSLEWRRSCRWRECRPADHQNDGNSAYAAWLQKLPLTRPTSLLWPRHSAVCTGCNNWVGSYRCKPEIANNNNNTPFSAIVVALLTCKPWRGPKSTKLIIKFLKVVSAAVFRWIVSTLCSDVSLSPSIGQEMNFGLFWLFIIFFSVDKESGTTCDFGVTRPHRPSSSPGGRPVGANSLPAAHWSTKCERRFQQLT